MSTSEQDQTLTSSTFLCKFPSNEDGISMLKDSLVTLRESIKILEIENCPTTSDASKLISNPVFCSALELLNNFTILKLKINEKLDEFHAKKSKIHEFNIARNFLISFESIEENQKTIYWKISEKFIKIKIIEGFSPELAEFVQNFLIDIVDTDSPHSDNPEMIDLIDSNGCNLLMKAVDVQQTSLIDELLDHSFYINKKSKDGKSAADIAWDKKNFEILIELLEANSTFPKDFNTDELDVDEASDNIEEFVKISNDMHKAIKSNNLTKVQKIINEKPNLSCFYNISNISAAANALKLQKLEIYKLLTENECVIGPEEDFNEIIEQQQKQMKSKVTLIHDSASKQLEERHLMILLANSLICHDNDSVKLRRKSIKEAFNILNEIPSTRKILQLSAMHKNFKIRFDFNRTSVEFMNPLGGDQTIRGLCQNIKLNEFYVYIGAKSLLDENEKFAAIGTLAHEFCHFAMDLAFFNDGKPYAIDDQINKEIFDGIIEKCKLVDTEEIVSLVFTNYEKDLWPVELIVRVPHMIANYKNDSERLDELKVIFKELFDYYNDVVEPNIIETRLMLDNLFNHSIEINFNMLTDAYKAKLHHSIVEFQTKNVKLNEIIEDKNSDIFHLLTSEQIRGILINSSRLTIKCAQKIKKEFYVDRKFIRKGLKNSLSFNQISSVANAKKMILLTDHAGAGKTTTFKHFSIKLKTKFPSFWILYIDLKRHRKVYEKHKENIDTLNILLEILSFTDQNKLEQNFFTGLFKANKVILLYDGVDEISPYFKEFFLSFIESVRKSTENQQWISTRPKHIHELMIKFEQKSYNLLPFDDDQQKKLIQHILKTKNPKMCAEKLQSDTKKIFDSLKFASFSSFHFIHNPLMIKLMTINYVNTGEVYNAFNSYSLYDGMVKQKIETTAEKESSLIQDTDKMDSQMTIWQIHQMFALKSIFPNGFEIIASNETIELNEFMIFKMWNGSEKLKWTPEAISRHGFLYVDNWDAVDEFPDFVHRTFAEYFLIRFLIHDIYELNYETMSENEISLRIKLLMSSQMRTAFERWHFIESYLGDKKLKKYSDKVYNIMMNDDVKKYFADVLYLQEKITVIKFFSIDSRFLKEFRYLNGETIFEQFYINRNENHVYDMKLKILEIYQKSLGSDWHLHTTCNQTQEISACDDEIRQIFTQNPTEVIKNFSDEIREKFFILFCFIERLEIPRDYVKRFFERYYHELLSYFSTENCMIEKFYQILRNIFSEHMKISTQDSNNNFSHELCNVAIYLTFFNDGKPYSIDDEENEQRFNEISEKLKVIDENYQECTWPSKLNSDKYKEISTQIYEYYVEIIEPNMNETAPVLKKILDESTDVFHTNLIKINYCELTDAYKAKIRHSKGRFQGEFFQLSELIDDKNSEIYNFLTTKEIRSILAKEGFLYVGSYKNFDTGQKERILIDYNTDASGVQSKHKTFDEITAEAEETKMILLADEIEDDKTIAFKQFAKKLWLKYPSYLVCYVELQIISKKYKKFELMNTEKVLREILSLNKEFEANFFETLFNNGKLILLYDEVDQILPKHKEFFMQLIESVRTLTKNQQWIALQPQYSDELVRKFNVKAYKLLPIENEI